MLFRFRYEKLGGHTHVKVYAGTGVTLGNCGRLTFTNDEWKVFVEMLGQGVGGPVNCDVQFIDDSQTPC